MLLQDSHSQAQPDELIDFHHLKARRGMSQLEIEDQVQTDLQRATGLAETGSETTSRLNRVLQLTGTIIILDSSLQHAHFCTQAIEELVLCSLMSHIWPAAQDVNVGELRQSSCAHPKKPASSAVSSKGCLMALHRSKRSPACTCM